MLKRINIRGIGLPLKKAFNCHTVAKNDLGLNTLGIHCIPYKCGELFIGQPGHANETRIKEH